MKTFIALFLSIFLAIPVSAQRFGKVVGNTNELMAQPVPDIHSITFMKGFASSNENLFLPFQYIRGSSASPNGQTVFTPTFGAGIGRYHLLSLALQSGTNLTLIYTNITTIISSNLTFITTNLTFIATNTTNFGITYIDASTTNFITFQQLFLTTNHVAGAPSTDTAVARWDGTTGLLLQDSPSTMADTTGAIRITGDSAGGSVLFSAPSGFTTSDWRWGHGMGTFLAVNDPFMGIGYNTKFTGGGFGQSNPADSAVYYALEANYRADVGNGLGATNYMEAYTEHIGSGGNSTRPYFSQTLKSNPEAWTTVLSQIAGVGSQFTVNDNTSGTDINIFTVFRNSYAAYLAGPLGLGTYNPFGYQLYGSNSIVNTPNVWHLEHGATSGALSDAKLVIHTGAGGGDPFINLVAGADEMVMGLDNSVAGAPWKLATGGILGTGDLLTVPSTGDATLLGSLTVLGSPDATGHALFAAPSGGASAWRMAHFLGSFLGVDDPSLVLGYNVANISGRSNTLDVANYLTFEANYRADLGNGLGDTNYSEWYQTFIGTNGASIRAITATSLNSNPSNHVAVDISIAGTNGNFNVVNQLGAAVFTVYGKLPGAQLNGYQGINVAPTTNYLLNIEQSAVSVSAVSRIAHTAVSGTSDAKFVVQTAAGGGDPFFNLVAGASEISMGLDNSVAGDPFKIAASSALGTSDLFTMTLAGVITLANDLDTTEGGTGVSTFTDGGVLIGNGAGDVQVTSAGSAGQVLTSNGAGVDPTFQAPASSGSVTSVALTAPGVFSVSGSPVTTSGTLAIGAVDPGGDRIIGFDNTSNDIRYWLLGSGLSYDQATDTLSATGGAGSVTSVALTMPGVFSVSGSPVTTSGTLAVSGVDPGADRLVGWDDTNGDIRYFVIGAGLNYDAATDTLTSTAVGTGGGDFIGPASATDNALLRFDGVSGKLGQNSIAILSDTGVLTGLTSLNISPNIIGAGGATFNAVTNTTLTPSTLAMADANQKIVSLADPGGNRLVGWNDTLNSARHIVIGGGLVFDVPTETLSATGGGAGSPVGNQYDIQFNDGGAFSADPFFNYNPTTDLLSVGGNIKLLATTSSAVGVIQFGSLASFHVYGNENVFAGESAGNFTLSSSSYNSGFGNSALISLTTGSFNSGVGYNALGTLTTGAENTSLGYGAGDGITTGTGNIAIGYAADVTSAAAANRIVIGGQASGTADNTATIGGVGANSTVINANAGLSASTRATVGGTIHINTTADNTTPLMDYDLPANTLGRNSERLIIRGGGSMAANANLKTITVAFGATTMATFSTTASAATWSYTAEVIRTGASNEKFIITYGSSDTFQKTAYGTATSSLSSTVTIQCTGSTDTTQEMLSIEWHPAPL